MVGGGGDADDVAVSLGGGGQHGKEDGGVRR